MLGLWLTAPSLSPQVPAGEPRQVSTLCPLSVLTDNMMRFLTTHPTDATDSPEPSTAPGARAGARRLADSTSHHGTLLAPLTFFPAPTGEAAVLLVAYPASPAARDSDRLTTCEQRAGLSTHVWRMATHVPEE